MGKIRFKSTPENYQKELIGLKNNTVRKADDKDARFCTLKGFISGATFLEIEIEKTTTGEYFTRTIKDVTFWEDLVIITWKIELRG